MVFGFSKKVHHGTFEASLWIRCERDAKRCTMKVCRTASAKKEVAGITMGKGVMGAIMLLLAFDAPAHKGSRR